MLTWFIMVFSVIILTFIMGVGLCYDPELSSQSILIYVNNSIIKIMINIAFPS